MDTILPSDKFSDAARNLIRNIDATAQYALRPASEPINTVICEEILRDIEHHLTPEDSPTALTDAETGLILAERFLVRIEDKALAIAPLHVEDAFVYARAQADIAESTRIVKMLVSEGIHALDNHFRASGEGDRFAMLSKVYSRRIDDSLSFIANLHDTNQIEIDRLLEEYGRQKRQDSPSPGPSSP